MTKKTGVAAEETQQLKQKGTHGPTTFILLDDTTEKVGVGKGSCFNNILWGVACCCCLNRILVRVKSKLIAKQAT